MKDAISTNGFTQPVFTFMLKRLTPMETFYD